VKPNRGEGSLILSRLDYGNVTLAVIPSYLLDWLQSVMYSAVQLMFTLSRYDHITPLIQQIGFYIGSKSQSGLNTSWQSIRLHWTAPPYLADEFYQPVDHEARRRLRSTSSSSLVVRCTRLSTIGDCAFPVTDARVWNGLPRNITSATLLPVFRSRLKSHVFRCSCLH